MQEELLRFDENTNPVNDYYKKLGKIERESVDKFEKYCLITANPNRAKKSRGDAIRFLIMANKTLSKINLDDLREFLRVLKQSNFSDYTKNDIKGHLQRFLKWYFKDWSERFDNFEDIKYNSEPQRAKEIKPEDVLKKEDIERLIKAERNIFWKTFIIVQFQGALRTLETRSLKWDMVDMQDLDIGWLNVSSKKNRNGTEKKRIAVPLNSQAISYLRELRKHQKENNVKSPYVFPSITNENDFISSHSVSVWFSRLTKKVLGKQVTNYMLRHSQGEHLHNLVRDGKLSKENALLMMGHSEKMFDKTYSHTDKQNLKEVLKKQVLDIDYLVPERKHELELKIEEQQKELIQVKKDNKNINESINILVDMVKGNISDKEATKRMKALSLVINQEKT